MFNEYIGECNMFKHAGSNKNNLGPFSLGETLQVSLVESGAKR